MLNGHAEFSCTYVSSVKGLYQGMEPKLSVRSAQQVGPPISEFEWAPLAGQLQRRISVRSCGHRGSFRSAESVEDQLNPARDS